jgi:hypothetical protein
VLEDVAREAVLAAKISGVAPSMHVFLSPNTDGDEATLISANVVAGRSYLHKVDAVLVPNSMLRFLEITSDKKFGPSRAGKKKVNGTSLTVAEALKGNGTTSNSASTRSNGTVSVVGPGSKSVVTEGGPKNSTRHNRATSAASDVMFTAAIGLPSLLLAMLLML